jgi:hypothetical protein
MTSCNFAIVGLYLPARNRIIMNYFKSLLKSEKMVLKKSAIKLTTAPRYSELSLKIILPIMMSDPDLRKYMPEDD